MPGMELWEEKAIGRKPFYQSRLDATDSFISQGWDGGIEAANQFINGALKVASYGVGYLKEKVVVRTNSQLLKGKRFVIGNRVSNAIASAPAVGGLSTLKWVADKFLIGTHFLGDDLYRRSHPTNSFVAGRIFHESIAFDEKKRVDMENTCGYAPNFKAVVAELSDYVCSVQDYYTAEMWRKEVTPHLLRATYEEELKKTFDSIQERYASNKGLLSRGMMHVTMRKAAQQLGAMFEEYSLKIANQTDYLEAPMTILPVKKPKLPELLTAEETKKWGKIARGSLFSSPKELEKKINLAMTPYQLTTERVQEIVRQNLTRPADAADKVGQAPYVVGKNPREDNERYRLSVSTVRDLKRVYEERSFFGKWFTPSGSKQRKALEQLGEALTGFGKSKAEIAQHLDLKSALGKEFDDISLLGIKQKEYVPAAKPKSVLEKTQGVALSIAEKTVDVSWRMGQATANLAYTGVNKAASSIGNAFRYLTGASAAKAEAKPVQEQNPVAQQVVQKPNPVVEKPVAPEEKAKEHTAETQLKKEEPKLTDEQKQAEKEQPEILKNEAPKEVLAEAKTATVQDSFRKDLSEATTQAMESAAEKEQQTSYTSSFFGSLYSYMPGRAYTPAEVLQQRIGERQQASMDEMQSAGADKEAFCQSAAAFLYFKMFQDAVKPNFTQDSCDMLSDKFLPPEAVSQHIPSILNSPAFKQAVVEPYLEKPEALQTDLAQLTKMYESFTQHSKAQMSSDSPKPQAKQAAIQPKENIKPGPMR